MKPYLPPEWKRGSYRGALVKCLNNVFLEDHVVRSQTFVSLNSRLESNKEEEEEWKRMNHRGALVKFLNNVFLEDHVVR